MIDRSGQLAALATMSPAQLRAEWRRVHRLPPPNLSADLLLRGIAYRLQEQRHGGLGAIAERELLRIAGFSASAPGQSRSEPPLRAGTRLVRAWQGRTYTVTVDETGFVFGPSHYTSLTAIAREITGAAWSGPRFFGLTKAAEVGKVARNA